MDKLILERAQSAAIARDFTLAARLYKTLLKNAPDDISILRALGGVYEKSGEDEKALPYYENILTFSPHDVDAMNSIGAIYRRLKQYEKSISYLNRALEENKKTAMINYTLGFTYKDMGNYDDAIDCFENVVDENPSDVLAYNHLGVIYSIKKEYSKAVVAFQRGLQTDPNHPILRYNLGHAYEDDRNYSEAIKCYELALKAKPGWGDAMRDLVNLLLMCQKIQRAYDVVQKSIQLHPKSPELIVLLGKVCINRYDYDGALKAFEQADKLMPDNPKILIALAEAYERKFRYSDASLAAKRAYQFGLSNLTDRRRFVHIMLSASEFKRAYEEIKKQRLEFPDEANILDEKAQYLICAGDENGAMEVFKQIKGLNPNYYHHYLEAGRRYCQIGKYDKALEYAMKYVSHRPSNPAVFNLFGRIYEFSGDSDTAITQYEKACSLGFENIFAKNEINRLKRKQSDSFQEEVGEYINDFNAQHIEIPVFDENEEPASEISEPVVDENPSPKVVENEPDEINISEMPENEATFEDVKNEIDAGEQTADEEAFDFDLMGGDLPPDESLAGLSKDEGLNVFDDIMEETEDVMENEKDDSVKETPPEEESAPKTDPEETVDADIDDFMPTDSPDDAMDMLRHDQEPRMDSRLVDKIDDAVKKMEESVDNVAKLAEEKTQEAINMAEEAVKKAEEVANMLPKSSDESYLENSPADFGDMVMDSPDFEAREAFGEPTFTAPFESESRNTFAEPFSALSASDLVPSAETRDAIDSAVEFLPKIVKMLEKKDVAAKYKSEIGLFQKLYSLSENLPLEQRKEFLSSKTRLVLDYLTAKLNGSPGLFTTIKNLLNSGMLDSVVDFDGLEKSAEKITGDDLVRKVMNDMKALTTELDDQNLAKALRNEADRILEKLP